MNPRILSQLRVGDSIRLLKSAGVDPQVFSLLDTQWQSIWSDPEEPGGELSRAARYFEARHGQADPGTRPEILDLGKGRAALACSLCDEQERLAFTVIMIVDGPGDGLPGLFEAVSRALHAEYLLNAELEFMAEELGQRYDELNMMFSAEAGSAPVTFGYESVAQMVRDTRLSLNVAASGVLIPGKRIECFDPESTLSAPLSPGILGFLRDQALSLLQANEAVVVNDDRDLADYGLALSLKEKLMIAPLHAGNTDIVGLLVVLNDRSAADFCNSDRNMLQVLANRVDKVLQVNFDPLTGLENAHSYQWAITRAVLELRAAAGSAALLSIDLDRFNVINDVSGREAGDELMVRVAGLILNATHQGDTVARLGADEFGVLLPGAGQDEALELGEKLRRAISEMNFAWQGEQHVVSACIGAAALDQNCQNASEALAMVEVATREAKEKGVNRLQLYQDSDASLVRRRGERKWVGRIINAIRDDHLILYAQPITPLNRQAGYAHFEVLVRMLDEDGRIVPPGDFIPAAEHYCLMPDLDWWVVRRALRELEKCYRSASGCGASFSINLSGQSLTDQRLLQKLRRTLQEAGGLVRHLVFEVTESAAIQNMQEALAFIGEIRALGCRFSLDDFGSGLSSFAYLQKLEVDYLKIDGSFVRLVDNDEVAAAMVSSINHVGQVMGLKTIGEYVENAQIADKLREIGVDFAQGYHFGRPRPLQEVLAELTVAGQVINA